MNASERPDTGWRHAARYPLAFWVLDARLAWPLLLWLAHLAWWTFALALLACALGALLAHLALPPALAWRRIKAAGRGWPREPRRPRRRFAR